MAERFEKRYSLPENLYIEGSPVVIAAGALLKDTVTGKMLVQIKLKNIGTNDIQALKAKIKAYEPNGAEVEGVEEYQYVDLSAGHGDEFGQKTPIYLPNNSTRKFEIGVTEVVVRGAEPWVSEFKQWKPLPNQKSINSFNDIELEKQFAIEAGGGKTINQTPDYIPDITLDLFRCTCGDINPENSAVCLSCGRNKDLVFKASDIESLKEKRDTRLQEEKDLAEKKAQELAEKKEIQKAKTKKILKIAVPSAGVLAVGIFFVILFTSIIPGSKYNNAKELLKQGKYDQAYTAFSELGDYSDSKKMCDNVYYKKAMDLFEKGKYKDAFSYKDKIKNENISANLNNSIFSGIQGFHDNGEYLKAREAYLSIDDTYNADLEWKSEADRLFNNKKYNEAKNIYDKIDSKSKNLFECNYYVAKQAFKTGNKSEGKKILKSLLTEGKWYEITTVFDVYDNRKEIMCKEEILIFKKGGKLTHKIEDYNPEYDILYKSWSITPDGKIRLKGVEGTSKKTKKVIFSLNLDKSYEYARNENLLRINSKNHGDYMQNNGGFYVLD